MESNEEQFSINLPDVCCGCLGKPDKIVHVVDKHTAAGSNKTSTLKLPVPICNNCIKKYRKKRIVISFITFAIVLLLFALFTLFSGNLKSNLLYGGIIGLGIGAVIGNMKGKPFFRGSDRIWFDNEEYQKRFEEMNKDLLEKMSS